MAGILNDINEMGQGNLKKLFPVVACFLLIIAALYVMEVYQKSIEKSIKNISNILNKRIITIDDKDLIIKVERIGNFDGNNLYKEITRVSLEEIENIETDENYMYIYEEGKALFQLIPLKFISEENKKELLNILEL